MYMGLLIRDISLAALLVFVVRVIRLHASSVLKLFWRLLIRGLGPPGDFRRAAWSGLELSWMPLGASGAALGGLLGCSWGLLGGSWRPLGAILGPPGAVLEPLGAVLWVMLPQVNFQKKSRSI